jgi:hypothetical protein
VTTFTTVNGPLHCYAVRSTASGKNALWREKAPYLIV